MDCAVRNLDAHSDRLLAVTKEDLFFSFNGASTTFLVSTNSAASKSAACFSCSTLESLNDRSNLLSFERATDFILFKPNVPRGVVVQDGHSCESVLTLQPGITQLVVDGDSEGLVSFGHIVVNDFDSKLSFSLVSLHRHEFTLRNIVFTSVGGLVDGLNPEGNVLSHSLHNSDVNVVSLRDSVSSVFEVHSLSEVLIP